MSKKNIILLTISIVFFLGALAIFIYANSSNFKKTISNTTIDNASLDNNTSEGTHFYDIDGNKLNIEDFSDKPIVILLWKSDNSKSYDMINLITKHYDEYKDMKSPEIAKLVRKRIIDTMKEYGVDGN